MHTARDNGVLDRNYRSERGMVIYAGIAAPFSAVFRCLGRGALMGALSDLITRGHKKPPPADEGRRRQTWMAFDV